LEKQAREVKFDRQLVIQQLRHLKSIFKATFWDGLITPAVKKKSSTFPIFIVGMMRSGSTLLETMLDAHSEVWGMGEDSFFNGNISLFRDRLVQARDVDAVEKLVLNYGRVVATKMKKTCHS